VQSRADAVTGPAAEQYVERLYPEQQDAGQDRGGAPAPVPQSVRQGIRKHGGDDAEALEELATSPGLAPPARRRSARSPTRSRPAAKGQTPSRARASGDDSGDDDGQPAYLALLLVGLVGIGGGAVLARRRASPAGSPRAR
jgi:hypothetical protein